MRPLVIRSLRCPRRPRALLAAMLFASLSVATAPARALSGYQLFESGQSRPIALSPNGERLFVVNTPDAHLEIFDVAPDGSLSLAASVPVGLEPIAVAVLDDDTAWVVNHLSDSVSVVSMTPSPRVVSTLLVGDEPGDVVFAGPAARWAFVTSAHRGQHSPNGGRGNRSDPSAADASNSLVEGEPRADVWVFDTTSLGSELGGTPASVLALFSDKPRALAVSPDGNTVYAAAFHSGNGTTVVSEGLVCNTSTTRVNDNTVQPACSVNGVTLPGGSPPPHKNQAGDVRPETGLILKFDRPGAPAGTWSDELGRNWNAVVKFDLPDRDVFAIDATTVPPTAIDAGPSCANGAGCWAGVGTILFNMAVNPVSGKIYVANTDSQNHVRFEGPGLHAAGASGKIAAGEPETVQGDLSRARITVLDGANVSPRHLNKHLDYALLPAPTSDRDKSLATPLGMAVSADGTTLYVAAFGSGEIGVYDTAELEADAFDPDVTNAGAAGFVGHIAVAGGGPTGVVLGPNTIYTLTRFDNTLRALDRASGAEDQAVALHNPEPDFVVEGRPFLYDARLTSSNGEASCASCHVFGDLDSLGWDLGNPDDVVVANGNPFNPLVPANADPVDREFHPMKGPMATQSLRGLENMGPQHWRGDRQGDETAAFEAFNVAFPGLVGRATELDPADMTRFREFALALRYPPNPIRKLDNSLRADELAGRNLYNGAITDTVSNCNGCHVLDASAGHFGGDGRTIFDGGPQHIKIPHLRNEYQKVGMFGMSKPDSPLLQFTGDFSHQGPQVRGFGVLHDGSVDTLARFFGLSGFSMNATQEIQMVDFMLAFDSDFAPIVGQQVTLSADNDDVAAVLGMISTLIARAEANFTSEVLGGVVKECDLIAHVRIGGRRRGHLYDPGSDLFVPDDGGPGIGDAALRGLAATPGQEVSYLCAPPGAGARMALDRDEDTLQNGVETNTGAFINAAQTGTNPALADTDGDGFDDGDEVAAGSDPTNPASYPGAPAPPVPVLGWLARLGLGSGLLSCAAFALRGRRTL